MCFVISIIQNRGCVYAFFSIYIRFLEFFMEQLHELTKNNEYAFKNKVPSIETRETEYSFCLNEFFLFLYPKLPIHNRSKNITTGSAHKTNL